MKLIIVFLLILPALFAQNNDRNAIHNHESFNSLIKGDWHLAQIEIVDGYNIFSDTNRFISQEIHNKKITITTDSIYNHHDSTLRYYVHNRNFSYKIQYDSKMRTNYLKLYEGKIRKLVEVESYEIIKCTIDELIIKSYQVINNDLGYTSISIVYTYRKENVSDLLKEFSDDWFYCSKQRNSFMTENDSLIYEFTRTFNDSACQKSDNHIGLEFTRENYDNIVKFEFFDEFSGVLGKLKYSIDPKNNLIYLISKSKSYVYKYELVNNEKLILSLDTAKTQKINTHTTK